MSLMDRLYHLHCWSDSVNRKEYALHALCQLAVERKETGGTSSDAYWTDYWMKQYKGKY